MQVYTCKILSFQRVSGRRYPCWNLEKRFLGKSIAKLSNRNCKTEIAFYRQNSPGKCYACVRHVGQVSLPFRSLHLPNCQRAKGRKGNSKRNDKSPTILESRVVSCGKSLLVVKLKAQIARNFFLSKIELIERLFTQKIGTLIFHCFFPWNHLKATFSAIFTISCIVTSQWSNFLIFVLSYKKFTDGYSLSMYLC